MIANVDENDIDIDAESRKVCPLTGGIIRDIDHYECITYDCADASRDKWSLLYGHKYHCPYEKKAIEDWHERQEKAKKYYSKLVDSLDAVRAIDLDEFFDTCKTIDEQMIRDKQEYNENWLISPYREEDEKFFVYLFKDDEIEKISLTENVLNFMATRYSEFSKKENHYAMSCCTLPKLIADAVNVNLQIKYNMDVTKVLAADNPVYIAASAAGKYIDAAYGWKWVDFKKALARHLETTEIVNYGRIIYIKQELDEIIRREE